MRFLFKTSYEQDIRLFRDRTDAFWYGLLALLVVGLPFVIDEYYVGETSWVFIYALCGLSLMVLVGYTGLVSLGHAAFLGIGAYAHAYFLQQGLPWVVAMALAVAITTAAGFVVGLPALRMTGIYLAIATLAFAVIIQEVFSRWESVTHGFAGMPVDKPTIFGVSFDDDRSFYFLCLFFLVVALWLTRNLLRAPTGRAWIAIRDSEIAAQSMGVNLAIYKSIAFAYSAGLMGLAGALFAHKIAYLAPDIFTILLSIQFLLLVIVGGLGSLHGAVFGAIFVALLPPVIAILRDSIPESLAGFAAATGIAPIGSLGAAIGAFLSKPGVEAGIFGLILVLVILLEPLGMYGRWLKIKLFFSTFPMYKKATFKRQKSYMRSERLR
ncbi:branched-chain amino acid ABC transporter permease [Enhydrobacter sp.]|jgi:branched-chain amino acid transport system permease protein|uniref:branched-chain amino acid ABC transporter permease n=1 Tax=Enhydrobacter sp. TaxID=1894999 RepID=UPI002628CA5D|nr:branched-chain amino acid ABC transporter permease [Enhydrobacter sp.]WIM09745.1 MAG: ABC transporter, permease protein 2 (cluster 4, leucine/isoleucine/valine/benzoate) [Enhydrobacter sp.]